MIIDDPEAIRQISDVINQINDISNTIASAVEEQTATANEMGRNVAESSKGSGEIAQNITYGLPDVVFVDWNMPVMNGLEFIRAVRANKENANQPRRSS